jgi:hypothetical protein
MQRENMVHIRIWFQAFMEKVEDLEMYPPKIKGDCCNLKLKETTTDCTHLPEKNNPEKRTFTSQYCLP